MKITFHGAARTVTGSKHLLQLSNGKKILLDCGMFQGMGKDTFYLNNNFGFDPASIDYVIISHAHIDHIGLLPKLVKEGYRGKIYCTHATASLAQILLRDSAHIQEADSKYANKVKFGQGKPTEEPLYTLDDVALTIPLMRKVKYNEWFSIEKGIELCYTDAGHIIGSACVHLKIKENDNTVRITFSGDLGRYGDAFLRSPEAFDQADYIIMESTYGDKIHPPAIETASLLLQHITHTCLEKKGKLIIPAFSVGRTQELLYALNQLSLEKRLPQLSYYVDSPLSVETTEMTKHFPQLFNKNVQEILKKDDDPFDFPGLTMIENAEVSKTLNFKREPCVIISASGMAEAGRVKHHIANNIEDAANTILIVGYCEPQSLGARLKDGASKVSIFGQHYDVKAAVESIASMSAHGDYNDMSQWLSGQDPRLVKRLFLVHGEYEVQQVFYEKLWKKGFRDVYIPKLHEEIGLGN